LLHYICNFKFSVFVRCYYIAQTCVVAKRWKEALALYERVFSYVDQAVKCYANTANSRPKERQQELEALEALRKEVDGMKYSCHASSILDSHDLNTEPQRVPKNNKPLEDRLDFYLEDASLTSKRPNLTKFPPDFEPIACKPLFFDVALNFVEFPSLQDRLDSGKQAGGITGFVKGLLWGGGKK